MDEAHTIEESATSFFSEGFSRLSVFRQLGRLYRRRRSVKKGLLFRLLSLLPGTLNGSKEDSIEEKVNQIRNAMDSLDEAGLDLCGGDGVFRLTPQKETIVRDRLSPGFISLRKHLNLFASLARELLDDVPEENADDPVVWELRSSLRRLDTVASVCTSFLEYKENQDKVMWIERRSGSSKNSSKNREAPWAVFNVTPIDVAPYLKEALFEPNKTVVCVSATLTIPGSGRNDTTGNSACSFDYWMMRSGLGLVPEREILTGIFPSPFPYQSRVLLAAPENAPLPTEAGYGVFVDMAAASLAEVAGGSALVLFTSYQALKSAYDAALPVLQKLDIRVLKQGDDDRNHLLADFLKDEKSVLFATDSFWEGVDAPGDTLRLVILCRLPFRSPNDPVFEARCEAIEVDGGSAFMDLSLPEAVMKFKQGFGRLMRRSSDHGIVAVLDGRLLRKPYGRFFLSSLPETKTCFEDMETILRAVERFLY